MTETEALEKLSAVKDATRDYDLKCAISEAFDWRGSALYYQSQVVEYTKEIATLHRKLDRVTADLKKAEVEAKMCDCENCFSREF